MAPRGGGWQRGTRIFFYGGEWVKNKKLSHALQKIALRLCVWQRITGIFLYGREWMKANDLTHAFQEFDLEAFRLELLPKYDVPELRDRVALYLSGQPLPPESKTQWMDYVSKTVQAGKRIRRVHVVPARLTPYLRYEIEWGYLYTASAGEEIFLLSHEDLAPNLLARVSVD